MAAAALAAPQRAMPDLLLHADKGLRGIARTGGTLLGADCSTEKMPAAIRLSFAGDADGLATLADRHGAGILSAQEPTTGVTPAWAAAHQNHADVARLLDKRGALLGVATLDECGATTPSFAAAQRGHAGVLDVLASGRAARGLDVLALLEKPNANGSTPLLAASAEGHLECVRFLVAHGVDVNARNADGESPALVAARRGHYDVLKLLVDETEAIALAGARARARPSTTRRAGRSPRAPARAKTKIVRLDEKGRPIADEPEPEPPPPPWTLDAWRPEGWERAPHVCEFEAADADGRTPLYVACEVGDFEAVHLLCERGADHEHATLSTASRPLFAAAQGGHLEVVKYLASAKRADLNYRNKRGVTPCLEAYDRAHMDVVAFLETKDIFIKPTATW